MPHWALKANGAVVTSTNVKAPINPRLAQRRQEQRSKIMELHNMEFTPLEDADDEEPKVL